MVPCHTVIFLCVCVCAQEMESAMVHAEQCGGRSPLVYEYQTFANVTLKQLMDESVPLLHSSFSYLFFSPMLPLFRRLTGR